VLPFNDFNNKNSYNSDFKNLLNLKEELDLNKEIILFKDNNPNYYKLNLLAL
jgi:hypothetical protein